MREKNHQKLPQSGGDPNATQEAQQQIKEEQTSNQDQQANKPPEGLPKEVVNSAVQVRDLTDESNVLNPATNRIEPREFAQLTAYSENGKVYQQPDRPTAGEGSQKVG